MRNARSEERIPTSMPIVILGEKEVPGVTKNMSISGVFIEVDSKLEVGKNINFTINLDIPGSALVLKCIGKVIRAELVDGKIGFGVRIDASQVDSSKPQF